MSPRSENFEPFVFLEGGGFHCRLRGLQAVPNSQPPTVSVINPPKTALKVEGEQKGAFKTANITFHIDLRIPSNQAKVENSSSYSLNPEAATFVPRIPQQSVLSAETPEYIPLTALSCSQVSFRFPDTFAGSNLIQIDAEECPSTSGTLSLSHAASSFSSQPSVGLVLNAEAADFTPLRSNRSSLRPEAADYVPTANAWLKSAHRPICSPLSPDAIEFSPSKAPLAGSVPESLEPVALANRKFSFNVAATVFVPSETSNERQPKPSREELLYVRPGKAIMWNTPWPIPILVSGVQQDWFDHRFQELAISEYVDIEFDGLGVDFGELPVIRDEDFDNAAELDAALTKPPPIFRSIPDLSMSSSGLVEMPKLHEDLGLPSPESILVVDQSEVGSYYASHPLVLPAPPRQIILNTGDFVILPEEFPRYDLSQSQKEIRTRLKSPLSQCVTLDYDIEIDESLKRLRDLPSIGSWADEVECEEGSASCTIERHIQSVTTNLHTFPAASKSILLEAPQYRPSDLTEERDLRKTCLISSAMQCLTVQPAADRIDQDFDDSLQRLRGLDSLDYWAAEVDSEDTDAAISDVSSEKVLEDVSNDAKLLEDTLRSMPLTPSISSSTQSGAKSAKRPEESTLDPLEHEHEYDDELGVVGEEPLKASTDGAYPIDDFVKCFELTSPRCETPQIASKGKGKGKAGPSEFPLRIYASPDAAYWQNQVESDELFGVKDSGPSYTEFTKDSELKNYILGADGLSPASIPLPEASFVEAAELACESEEYILLPPSYPPADIIEPGPRSLVIPDIICQDDPIGRLKDVTAVEDNAQRFVSSFIRKNSPSIPLESPRISPTFDIGNISVQEKPGSGYLDFEDEDIFDNDTEYDIQQSDVDIIPEARSTTPTPSPSLSGDEFEASIEKDEAFSPICLIHVDDGDAQEPSIIEQSSPTSSPSFSSPRLKGSELDQVGTKSLPPESSAVTLPFRPARAAKVGKPCPSETSVPVQLPSELGNQTMMPGRSESKLTLSTEIQDFHALDRYLRVPMSNARRDPSLTTSEASTAVKIFDRRLFRGNKRRSTCNKNNVSKHRRSPLCKMELIGEDRESVTDEEILKSPQSSMDDLRDLGRKYSDKLMEVSKVQSGGSRIVDGARRSPRKSYIPVLPPTRPATISPLQPSSSFCESRFSSGLMKRPVSNNLTRMRQRHTRHRRTVIDESVSGDWAEDGGGLSTILEDFNAINNDELAASSQTSAASLPLAKPQSPASSLNTASVANEEKEESNELLSIIEGRSPLHLPDKMYKDRISPGAWLKGGKLTNDFSAQHPSPLIDHVSSLWPCPFRISPRTSSLFATYRTDPLKRDSSAPTISSIQGIRATVPNTTSPRSIMRQIIANYPVTTSPASSSQHPSFEFFSGVQAATTQAFSEVPSTPTGFIASLRGTPSVRKAFDQAYATERRARSPQSFAQYNNKIYDNVESFAPPSSSVATTANPASDRHLALPSPSNPEARSGRRSSPCVAQQRPATPVASIAAALVEVEGSFSTPRRARDVLFTPVRRGGQKRQSKFGGWIHDGVKRKLVKNVKANGRELSSNGKIMAHAATATADPTAVQGNDQHMGSTISIKPPGGNESFFSKIKKIMMFGLGMQG